MSARGGLLLVSDARTTDALAEGLRRRGFHVEQVASAAAAMERLAGRDPDVVLVDLELPDSDGLAFCERLVATHPAVPVIAVAPAATLDSAVGSMRAGAYDYVARPLKLDAVAIAVARAVQHRSLTRELRRLRVAVQESASLWTLKGSSGPMRDLYELIEQVAQSDVSVMITGETGTGKELVARAVHHLSGRRTRPFVAVNCAALPEALLETELFGHVKGAFTDARSARLGLFAQARGGTLFLDEVGDMPLSLQPKLLRVLQDRTVRPVGSDREVPFDARIVAATNRDLESLVAEGRFRSDLYFRLNVVQADVPPLRSRGSDILLLAQHFLDLGSARSGRPVEGLSHAAARKLLDYSWPGNVRELENCIERAVALSRGREIGVEDLPRRIRSHSASDAVLVAAADPAELVPMHVVEARYIRRVLQAVRNNKTQAARVLGFDRKTLYRKLDRYGIDGD